MSEKLLPLKIPPGLVNNGTAYQQSGRWWDGNLVRFFQGNIQPIGGWTTVTLSGATILGIPRAALAWQTKTGVSYLAVGTTEGLYVISATGVVSDITPSMVVEEPDALRVWQLSLFGSYLVAVSSSNSPTYTPAGAGFVWVWRGDVSVACERADADFDLGGGISNDPYDVHGVVVTPERFLVAICGHDPYGLERVETWVS